MSASDWVSIITSILMVLITVAYVIATIRIQKANEKAAKASNDQLEESKRQFNENRRLDVMPYLQFDPSHDPHGDYELELALNEAAEASHCYMMLRVKNIGRGTAINIHYVWTNFEGQYNRTFPVSALQSGDNILIKTTFIYGMNEFEQKSVFFDMKYMDLLEHEYIQRIEFSVAWKRSGNYAYIYKLTTNSPTLVN